MFLTDSNYKVALNLLKEEFLDKEFIIDETLTNILKAMPSEENDPEFLNIIHLKLSPIYMSCNNIMLIFFKKVLLEIF